MKYDKQFLVLGNMNAVTYKDIFPLIKDNRMWYGYSIRSGDREFGVPEHYPLNASSIRVDENGKKYIKVKGVRWFTNIPHGKMNEKLILYKQYLPAKYPKYDNDDAINVDKTADIPVDYDGAMGVPITFLDKYNPNQFEIIDIDRSLITKLYGKQDRFFINGRKLYVRILIRKIISKNP